MPKMRMKASEDKEKIRRLRQDIKDMKIDMKETFSVMETMEKPKNQRKLFKAAVIAAAVVIVLIALAVYLIIAL